MTIHLKCYTNSKNLLQYLLLLFLLAGSCYAGGLESENSSDALQGRSRTGTVFTPGDGVWISTFPDTISFLHGVFSIDDQGYVELPIVGKVKISHMSKLEFEDYIKQEFRDYLRFPNIKVKPMIRLSVLGGIPRPGFYYFDQDRSLWDVLYRVGGTMDEDGLKDMRWERDGKVIEDDLVPYLEKGISLRRMRFQSGDQVWVKTPGKPGALDDFRLILTTVGAVAALVTAYATLSRVITDGFN